MTSLHICSCQHSQGAAGRAVRNHKPIRAGGLQQSRIWALPLVDLSREGSAGTLFLVLPSCPHRRCSPSHPALPGCKCRHVQSERTQRSLQGF